MIVVNEIHDFEEIPPQVQYFVVFGSTNNQALTNLVGACCLYATPAFVKQAHAKTQPRAVKDRSPCAYGRFRPLAHTHLPCRAPEGRSPCACLTKSPGKEPSEDGMFPNKGGKSYCWDEKYDYLCVVI